jgi:3-methyl-2-oxobutanoate hydroxymethyltransferase
MGHLGLTPQSIYKFGTYVVRAKEEEEANKLIEDAHLLQAAGCFAIVIEKVPAKLAERVAKEVSIPIIGIGAGGDVDGQVLVMHDMLGVNLGKNPKFVHNFMEGRSSVQEAMSAYVAAVKNGTFPDNTQHAWA